MLCYLPKRFTRADVIALRRKRGMSPNPKFQIANWKRFGFIVSLSDGAFEIVSNGSKL